jgi:hypothetical protein
VGQILNLLAQVQAVLQLPEAPQTAKEALDILTQCLGSEHPATQHAQSFYEHLTGASSEPSTQPSFTEVVDMILEQAKSGQLAEATSAMNQLATQAQSARAQHPEAIARFYLAQLHAVGSDLPSARKEAVRALELARAVHDEALTQACERVLSNVDDQK